MKKLNLSLLLIAFSSSSLLAQSSFRSSTNLSSNKFLKAITPDRVSYFSAFAGPSLGGQGDPVDANGAVKDGAVNTWNQLSLGWQINKNFRFIANPRFAVNHNAQGEDEEFEVLDPVVGVSGTWYKSGSFTFGGGVNTIMPGLRTESTIDKKLLFNPGGFNYLSYQVNPKVSVGSWVWARYKVYEGGLPKDTSNISYFVAPNISYKINDNLSTTAFYQINGSSIDARSAVWDNDETLNLMASVKVSKLLTLEPMITMFRESEFETSKANFNMWLSGRFY